MRGRAFRWRLALTVLGILCLVGSTVYLSADEPDSGLQKARRSFDQADLSAVTFRAMNLLFPSRTVKAGQTVWELERAPQTLDVTYEHEGKSHSLEAFLERNYTNALLVIHEGRIVYETYRNGADEDSRFISFSTGKSVTSTLVGAAVEDGFIKSVNDPLTQYLPELDQSAYKGVTVKDALQMASGVAFVEEYDFGGSSDLTQLFDRSMVKNLEPAVQYAFELEREHAPGERFHYNTLETCILGWLVERATGKPLADYQSERIWIPAGMESDAHWLVDGEGREFAGGMFNATLRDYGRFGLMMLNGGRANGGQIVSAEWVRQATRPDRDAVQFGKLHEGYPLGYGYLWWLFPGGAYEAQGVYGQFIYVHPERNLVIIKLSHWPEAWVDDLEIETYALFEAIGKFLE